jgi:hypothetical protein
LVEFVFKVDLIADKDNLFYCVQVAVMSHICQEAEASLDYAAIFKEIMKSVPLPMSPLESLASSAVRTAKI